MCTCGKQNSLSMRLKCCWQRRCWEENPGCRPDVVPLSHLASSLRIQEYKKPTCIPQAWTQLIPTPTSVTIISCSTSHLLCINHYFKIKHIESTSQSKWQLPHTVASIHIKHWWQCYISVSVTITSHYISFVCLFIHDSSEISSADLTQTQHRKPLVGFLVFNIPHTDRSQACSFMSKLA